MPELVLPYTEEDCAPIPPEEFPESDEEIEDVLDGDADGGSVDKSNAKKVEEDANPNTEMNVEAENVRNV